MPNESENSWETQKKINTGLMSGAPDLIILLPYGRVLLPETKTETGYQSPAQKIFQAQAASLGHVYFIYKTLQQFQEIITPYLREAGING